MSSNPAGSQSGDDVNVQVHRVIPYLHVLDVEASARFYGLLGLELVSAHRDHAGAMVWALVEAKAHATGEQGASLMLARASGPIDAGQQAAMLYMHVKDVARLRRQLIEAGVTEGSLDRGASGKASTQKDRGEVFAIQFPFYMPAGELRVHDPDGYVIWVGEPA